MEPSRGSVSIDEILMQMPSLSVWPVSYEHCMRFDFNTGVNGAWRMWSYLSRIIFIATAWIVVYGAQVFTCLRDLKRVEASAKLTFVGRLPHYPINDQTISSYSLRSRIKWPPFHINHYTISYRKSRSYGCKSGNSILNKTLLGLDADKSCTRW